MVVAKRQQQVRVQVQQWSPARNIHHRTRLSTGRIGAKGHTGNVVWGCVAGNAPVNQRQYVPGNKGSTVITSREPLRALQPVRVTRGKVARGVR